MIYEIIQHLFTPQGLLVFAFIALGRLATVTVQKSWLSKYPLINGKEGWELFYTNSKQRFVANAKALIDEGLVKSGGKIFCLITDNGPAVVLSAQYAHELRNHVDLSFHGIVSQDFHTNIPGFEAFKQGTAEDEIFEETVRSKVIHALGALIEPLSAEIAFALEENWTNNSDWHEINLKLSTLNIVAQSVSKVFVGEELCRDPDWLRIAIEYTVDSIDAAHGLRSWPKLLRPVVHWFLPSCQKIRATVLEARAMINPILEKRRRERAASVEQGTTPEVYPDALEWFDQVANGRQFDAVAAQLMLSVAAIHTMTDLMTQTIFDLCERSDIIQALRKESIPILSKNGWSKTTLYNLKLMDSVIKESQRLKPAAMVSMRREAQKGMELPDGTKIPKGTNIMVSGHQMWDSSVYPNADEFDGYRFFRMRQEVGYTSGQLINTSPSHLGFGHGKHACPGRGLAATQLKIALCHILLKYDLKPVEGSRPMVKHLGIALISDPFVNIAIRRRKEEIDLTSLKSGV